LRRDVLELNWSDEALDDLAEIVAYIADRNEGAARRLRALVTEAADRLPSNPTIYRPGRIDGTREVIVHPNYIIVYRVTLTAVDIVAVLHARQQYP
jgi:addiction module RelE/StbE family toxin